MTSHQGQGTPPPKNFSDGGIGRGGGTPPESSYNDSSKTLPNCLPKAITKEPGIKRKTPSEKENVPLTSESVEERMSTCGSETVGKGMVSCSGTPSTPPLSTIPTSTCCSEIVIPGPIPDLFELINDQRLFVGNFFADVPEIVD